MKARARRLLRRIQVAFLRLTSLSFLAEDNYLLLAAILAGVLAGLGSASFIYALAATGRMFFGGVAGLLAGLGPGAVVFLPALGGLVVGPLVARFAPEARGHGVPEVMTAVATRGGEIKGRVAVVKILASAVSIGSGGSAGQEGPMVQIGAAAASAAGRRLGITRTHMRTFVACGAAGGLAAVFNAPVGGALFALEVITGELTPAFGAVILASVSATVVSRSLFGDFPSFTVPRYELVHDIELAFYAVLGLLAGLVSSWFIRTLHAAERRFETWEFPARFKPVVGGVLVGLIGRFVPEVFGTGATTIEAAIWGTLAPLSLVLLVPLKVVATSLTLGSGGSGGVFGPSMFVGAMLGGSFGALVHAWLPAQTAGSGAYALVGMGALVGGTALAPLTAIILLFEMTDDYRVILPVMVATVLSIVVTRALVGESIYTLKLKERNIAYYPGVELQRVHAATVREAMRSDLPRVPAAADVVSALDLAARARAPALPIVDEAGEVVGLVTLEQLSAAVTADPRPPAVSAVMTDVAQVRTVPTERLDAVLARLGESDIDALAVVPSEESRRLLGVVSRRDVLRAYEQALRRS